MIAWEFVSDSGNVVATFGKLLYGHLVRVDGTLPVSLFAHCQIPEIVDLIVHHAGVLHRAGMEMEERKYIPNRDVFAESEKSTHTNTNRK